MPPYASFLARPARNNFRRSTRRRQRPARARRRGAAVVEFAVCLPVIVTLVFASIEACSMIHLKQALQTSACEAARVAIAIQGNAAAAVARGQQILDQQHVFDGTVTVAPAEPQHLAPGEPVTVTVTAPIDANRVMPPWFFQSGPVTVRCTMLKEGNHFSHP